MTTPVETPESTASAASETQKQLKKAPGKRLSQERIMLGLTLIFAAGILFGVILPEDSPARGIVITFLSLAAFWIMFKGY